MFRSPRTEAAVDRVVCPFFFREFRRQDTSANSLNQNLDSPVPVSTRPSEFLSAVRRASRAIKQERTSTESNRRRLNRWPPGGAAAGGRRRMAGHHQIRRGGGRVDTHR